MKHLPAKLISLAILLLLFVTLTVLSAFPSVCEFFATGFSRGWIAFFGTVFGWLPFSMYELFLIVAVVGAVAFVVFLVIFLVKRRWKKLLSMTLAAAIAVMSFLNIYTATATFAYNRQPLPEEIYSEYTSDEFSEEDAVALAELMVEKANSAYQATEHDENGNIVYPYSLAELSDMLAEEYKKIDGDYLSSYTPRGKWIVNKWIMSQLHITGVFFAPFGEANINGNEKNLYLPTTLAHEMAHGKGVMQEYQADLIAFRVCLMSENPYLHYGAATQAANIAIGLVSLYPNTAETVSRLRASLNSGISTEQANYSAFYSQFDLVDNLGEWFNNIYLKLQKQQQGTESYVKPGETHGTGQTDDDGKEIVQIISFSGKQNVLIQLYKENFS